MPKRDWRLRITDMQEAAGKIVRYVDTFAFEAFAKDAKTIDAVLRNVEVIGEAAAHIPKSVRNRHPAIRWRDLAGMRNVRISPAS